MFAIVISGGKQYRVETGQTLRVERLPVSAGDSIKIEDVLLVGENGEVRVGAPRVSGAVVEATVVEHGRSAKTRVFKFKHRKHSRRTRGHRQAYTALRIDRIQA